VAWVGGLFWWEGGGGFGVWWLVWRLLVCWVGECLESRGVCAADRVVINTAVHLPHPIPSKKRPHHQTATDPPPESNTDRNQCKGPHGCDGGDAQPAFEYVVNAGGISQTQDYPYKGLNGFCRCVVIGVWLGLGLVGLGWGGVYGGWVIGVGRGGGVGMEGGWGAWSVIVGGRRASTMEAVWWGLEIAVERGAAMLQKLFNPKQGLTTN